LDYLIWLLGQPEALICNANRVSNLQVDVEDCATIVMRFPQGTQADIHLDFVQRSYTRFCKLVGEQGTIVWDYGLNQVRVHDVTHGDWQVFTDDFEANQMYLAEVEQFLTCITHRKRPVVTLQDGVQALQVALAAHKAAAEGRWINVAG
jgi:predicted dehydrogenase